MSSHEAPAQPPSALERYIGLMTGTSMDGVDAVLMEVRGRQWQCLAHVHGDLSQTLRQTLLDLNLRGSDELHRAALAQIELAQLQAQMVASLTREAGVTQGSVRAIGSHGQTVRHRPDLGYTWQLNEPSLLAELTGIDVVADLRRRDLAAGGQGAPLVVAFHAACFGADGQARAVLNLGGMANVSILGHGDSPMGYDCGPGNVLLDLWCQRCTGQAYDQHGLWSQGGRVHAAWLRAALDDPYFALPPPKSTGRDHFHDAWLQRWLSHIGLGDSAASDLGVARDIQATLAELTAATAAQAVREHAPRACELVVCGGGALNDDLMARLRRSLHPLPVRDSQAWGLDVMQVEAAAFAWLAWAHVHRVAGNVPAVTGARGPRVLGALYPA